VTPSPPFDSRLSFRSAFNFWNFSLDIIDFWNYSLAPAACNAGVPLIFDEIVSGFRYAPGGAQEKYSVTPDLACVAKIVAGYVLLPSPTSLVKDDRFT